MNGELTMFNCDVCGHRVEVVYPMLYHDMDHKLMIWMDPVGQIDPNGLDKSKFRFGTLLENPISNVSFRPEKKWLKKY